jgi:hypothetical protein
VKNSQSRQAEPPGLDPDELPPLDSHDAAKTWLEIIGRAVTTGRLGDKAAQAAIRAVRNWLEAEADRLEREKIREMEEAIEELRDQDWGPGAT